MQKKIKLLSSASSALLYSQSDIRGGELCFKGTRIPAYFVMERLASGWSTPQIIKMYPDIAKDDITLFIKELSNTSQVGTK